MSYIGNTPGVSSQRVVLEEVVTGSPKSAFVPQAGYIKGYVDVLVNGIEIDATDFTAADGITVTLGTAAAVGDTVKIKAWLPRGLSDGYLKSEADARFLNLAGGTLTGGLTAAGNFLMTANDGNARVVGVSNGTNTTLVLQGGGNGAGALGGNIELGRDGNNMYDATVSRFRSLDGSTTYGQFDANGLGIGGATEAGSLLRLYKSTGDAKITLETVDAYAAFINYSGASSEMSAGFVKSDNSFRFCQAGDVSSAERMRLDMNNGVLRLNGAGSITGAKLIARAGGLVSTTTTDESSGCVVFATRSISSTNMVIAQATNVNTNTMITAKVQYVNIYDWSNSTIFHHGERMAAIRSSSGGNTTAASFSLGSQNSGSTSATEPSTFAWTGTTTLNLNLAGSGSNEGMAIVTIAWRSCTMSISPVAA